MAGFIGHTSAARVIYSAVFAAWIFVALALVWSQGAWLVALLAFFLAFAGSYALNLSVRGEKRLGDPKKLLREDKLLDPKAQKIPQ